jgi:hypothetical protein
MERSLTWMTQNGARGIWDDAKNFKSSELRGVRNAYWRGDTREKYEFSRGGSQFLSSVAVVSCSASAFSPVRDAGGHGSAGAGLNHEAAKAVKDHEEGSRLKCEGPRLKTLARQYGHYGPASHFLKRQPFASWSFTFLTPSCFRHATTPQNSFNCAITFRIRMRVPWIAPCLRCIGRSDSVNWGDAIFRVLEISSRNRHNRRFPFF